MSRKLLLFIPAILWFLLSFYLLTLPGSSLPKFNWFDKVHGDKVVHIGMFATLVILFLLPLKTSWRSPSIIKIALVVSILALAYGIAMEFVQQNFIANRSFELTDIAADAVGSFLPLVLYFLFYRKKI